MTVDVDVLVEMCSDVAEALESYLPDVGTDANWSGVDPLQLIQVVGALGALSRNAGMVLAQAGDALTAAAVTAAG